MMRGPLLRRKFSKYDGAWQSRNKLAPLGRGRRTVVPESPTGSKKKPSTIFHWRDLWEKVNWKL